MQIVKCDKCKGEIPEHETDYKVTLENFNMLIGLYDRSTVDLCKNCKNEFITWVTGFEPVERKRY